MAIDLRPKIVDIAAYAGNTVTLSVTVPAGVADNFIWEAHVRGSREATGVPDAVWEITEPVAPGGPAYLTLSSADTSRLAGLGVAARRRDAKTGTTTVVQTYSGQWDCQARHPIDVDPVYTFVQGSLTIDLDVTRP